MYKYPTALRMGNECNEIKHLHVPRHFAFQGKLCGILLCLMAPPES